MSELEQELETQEDNDMEIEDTSEITKVSPRQVHEKKKRVMSEKQAAAFEKARKVRLENIELKKMEKEMKQEQLQIKKSMTQKQRNSLIRQQNADRKAKVEEYNQTKDNPTLDHELAVETQQNDSDSSESESEEEVIEVVKKKKVKIKAKPKPVPKKSKKKKVVLYVSSSDSDDSSESESEEEELYPQPRKRVKRYSEPKQKQDMTNFFI
jgi:hypothetical protein